MIIDEHSQQTPRVIDAHQHFWRSAAQQQPWRQPEHHGLERDFEPGDLDAELDRCGIDGTVLIQSVDEPAENDRLARYARHSRVAGVVGWLPLADPAAARAEVQRLDIPRLVGFRCLVADDPLDWLGDAAVIRLFTEIAERGLAWDVVPITRRQVDAVIGLARAVPELKIIVDHLGRPPVDEGGWEPWASQLAELSALPNVAIKISIGIDLLTRWCGWQVDPLRRYVRHVRDCFGPDRMLLASNWPVVLLRADYRTAWSDLAGLFDDHDAPAVRGGNAERWYGLPPPATG